MMPCEAKSPTKRDAEMQPHTGDAAPPLPIKDGPSGTRDVEPTRPSTHGEAAQLTWDKVVVRSEATGAEEKTFVPATDTVESFLKTCMGWYSDGSPSSSSVQLSIHRPTLPPLHFTLSLSSPPNKPDGQEADRDSSDTKAAASDTPGKDAKGDKRDEAEGSSFKSALRQLPPRAPPPEEPPHPASLLPRLPSLKQMSSKSASEDATAPSTDSKDTTTTTTITTTTTTRGASNGSSVSLFRALARTLPPSPLERAEDKTPKNRGGGKRREKGDMKGGSSSGKENGASPVNSVKSDDSGKSGGRAAGRAAASSAPSVPVSAAAAATTSVFSSLPSLSTRPIFGKGGVDKVESTPPIFASPPLVPPAASSGSPSLSSLSSCLVLGRQTGKPFVVPTPAPPSPPSPSPVLPAVPTIKKEPVSPRNHDGPPPAASASVSPAAAAAAMPVIKTEKGESATTTTTTTTPDKTARDREGGNGVSSRKRALSSLPPLPGDLDTDYYLQVYRELYGERVNKKIKKEEED
ncbi:unnamed protein product [Vitrella brassicaformis CCMP3155]|uniref:Uncharacterized protein n=1 Tax=Vitrella brassicaformis (strain CCMP3155) TaxID=1169540 RepID=A0A0G4ETP5_VITBC|nr:unnamed protein product [Vitrella brassicaformis CCMP3155]|eukprot:CEM01095.1 unnamed protein product [Vitrella brassicaformis CCMP3155]